MSKTLIQSLFVWLAVASLAQPVRAQSYTETPLEGGWRLVTEEATTMCAAFAPGDAFSIAFYVKTRSVAASIHDPLWDLAPGTSFEATAGIDESWQQQVTVVAMPPLSGSGPTTVLTFHVEGVIIDPLYDGKMLWLEGNGQRIERSLEGSAAAMNEIALCHLGFADQEPTE